MVGYADRNKPEEASLTPDQEVPIGKGRPGSITEETQQQARQDSLALSQLPGSSDQKYSGAVESLLRGRCLKCWNSG
jgi:hypothetical protein